MDISISDNNLIFTFKIINYQWIFPLIMIIYFLFVFLIITDVIFVNIRIYEHWDHAI